MKRKFALMALMLFGYFSTYAQAPWKSSYEDDKIKIEYKITDCNDTANGFNFQYYFLKIENKTSNSLNVQYLLGDTTSKTSNEELSNNLILKPREVIKGDCSTGNHLKLFSKDNKSKISKPNPFSISKIKTYAL